MKRIFPFIFILCIFILGSCQENEIREKGLENFLGSYTVYLDRYSGEIYGSNLMM